MMAENKRIIKFRAWDGEKMYSPVLGKGGKGYKDIYHYQNLIVTDDPVMQFVGLLDDNKQEIYEADIVRVCSDGVESIHQVVYGGVERCYPAFHLEPQIGMECNDLQFSVVDGDTQIEVIGNIYEHPELLTAK